MPDEELMSALMEAKADMGMPPMKRVRFPTPCGKGYMEASVALDADLEDVKNQMTQVHNSIESFNALPEVDRVKYYLAHAYAALRKIMDTSHVDTADFSDLYNNPQFRKYTAMISNAACIADMAVIMIPDKYRTTDIKI